MGAHLYIYAPPLLYPVTEGQGVVRGKEAILPQAKAMPYKLSFGNSKICRGIVV